MANKSTDSKVSGKMFSERFSNPPKAPIPKKILPPPAPARPTRQK